MNTQLSIVQTTTRIALQKGFVVMLVTFFATSIHAAELELVQVLRDGVGGVSGIEATRWAALSPDGRHLYATGQTRSTVAVFERDRRSGMLTQRQLIENGVDGVSGLAGANNLAVSRDGRHVYVGAPFERSLAVFERHPASGELSQIQVLRQGVDVPVGFDFMNWTAVSDDGRNVYTTSFFNTDGGFPVPDGVLSVFSRDRSTGFLSLVQTLQDGEGGEDDLLGSFPARLGPGGRQLYVGAFFDRALAVFERDPSLGTLTKTQVVRDGEDGVVGLFGAVDIAIPRSGRQVYVATAVDNGLLVFDRAGGSGTLTFREAFFDGVGGVDGLAGASEVILTPDGSTLFVAGLSDNAIAIFERESDDGSLDFEEVVRLPGPGLGGAISMSMSRDGKHLYVAASADGAITVFRIDD